MLRFSLQSLLFLMLLGGPALAQQDFEDARDQAFDAVQALRAKQKEVDELSDRVAKATNAQMKTGLLQQLDAAAKTAAQSRERARDALRSALKHADRQTLSDDLNLIRYFLGYISHNEGNYFESAVLGEFVAMRYPQSAVALPCAKIALASRMSLYQECQDQDRKFEMAQIVAVAKYLLATWPNRPEAELARKALTIFE
jgi:hypothetical protein